MADEDMIAEYEGTSTGNVYIHGPGTDEPWALMTRKGTYYYHADGLGSIVAITDGSRRTVQEYEYDFFGGQGGGASFGGLHDMKNRIKQPYAFTGREFDRETRLYYYRARYYDPSTGRFTQQDPIGYDGGLNLYAYVAGNPVNAVDPSGLTQQDVDNAVNWLKHHHPELFKGISPSIKDSGLPGDVGGYAIPGFDIIRIDSEAIKADYPMQGINWIVAFVAHELMHLQISFIDNFNGVVHDQIYDRANVIRREYEVDKACQ